jgi:Cu(I)/Ag(I) efflux system membrane fusion protein
MTRTPLAPLAGALVIAATATILSFSGPAVHGQTSSLTWQAVHPNVPTGKGVRVEVRLVAPDAKTAAEGVTVTSTRIDMGPDGMATMTAPLRPVAASSPGGIAFETDLPMAGRWALTISGTVRGRPEPVSGVVVFTATDRRSEDAMPPGRRKVLYYRNPMGLADVSPVPKKDAMGMDYIAVYADEVSGPAGTIRIGLDKVQRAGVRTQPVARHVLGRTVRTFGNVVPDESRLAVVTAKFSGFVEHLFAPVTGIEVRGGAPLMRVWIESPEMLRRQSDYLLASRGAAARPGEAETTRQNLRLFGIPDQAIDELRRTGEPIRSMVLTAPAAGTVLEKPALVGMRFSAGDALFRIADLSRVWVIAQVAERDIGLVRAGQPARVAFAAFPEAPVEGRVAFVYPEINPATRTTPVRIELPNPGGRIRTGFYADVAIEAALADESVVAIPASAVIDSGTRRVAFVARGDGLFEPRDLTLGRRGNGLVEVRAGIAEGEEIVVSGNFLIDAESNLRAALSAFNASEAAK